MATRMNPYPTGPGQTSGRSDGSRTMTMHDVPTGEQGGEGDSGSGGAGGEGSSDGGVLRLRGGGNTRRVVWSSETVDNEGMGKKKSKICCIFHKRKEFDESSDESSGSDSHESDSSLSSVSSQGDDINASKSLREKREKQKSKSEECDHDHDHVGGDSHTHNHKSGRRRSKQRGGGSSTIVETPSEDTEEKPTSKPIPNKYERGFA